MNVTVLGKTGQLAQCLAETASGHMRVRFFGHAELDLADAKADLAILDKDEPQILINAAAYTAVDRAESEPDMAHALNAEAPRRLAEYCASRGLPLIHVSTDYVFDGTSPQPYREDDEPNPINIYGQSKLVGELAIASKLDRHLIIRTSWVYSAYGANFVKTMLRLGAERDQLRIVADQIGRPTSAHSLARTIWALTGHISDAPDQCNWGLYHYADEGVMSWAEFAETIFVRARTLATPAPLIVPIPTTNYPTPAERPKNSVLDCAKILAAFNITPSPVANALDDVLARLAPETVR